MPGELRSFAMTNGVMVLSHKYPLEPFLELLMINPELTRGKGRFFKTWIARYQAKMKDIPLEKRYLIEIVK